MPAYQKVHNYIDFQGLKQVAVARKAEIPFTTFYIDFCYAHNRTQRNFCCYKERISALKA